jgi:hypothetical protein
VLLALLPQALLALQCCCFILVLDLHRQVHKICVS